MKLCEFWRHCNKTKRHIFLCLFFLLTITGRNEAIIVDFKALFVLNGTFITFSHHQISRNYERLYQLSGHLKKYPCFRLHGVKISMR